ncbi:MAG: signal peptidase I [Pseudonocardia sp.]
MDRIEPSEKAAHHADSQPGDAPAQDDRSTSPDGADKAEPDVVAEPEPDKVAEPEPDAAAEPSPERDKVAEPEPDAAAEPSPEPDKVAEPEPDAAAGPDLDATPAPPSTTEAAGPEAHRIPADAPPVSGLPTSKDPAAPTRESSGPDHAAPSEPDQSAEPVPAESDTGPEPGQDAVDEPERTDRWEEGDRTAAPVHEPIVTAQKGRVRTAGGARWARRVVITVVTLALMVLIPAFVARLYVIPSGSMETTLHGCKGCDNDRVLVDRLAYRYAEPRPGEIVVFNAGPEVWANSEVQNPGTTNPIVGALEEAGSHIGITPPAGTDFAKRVIAVGGQTVQCCDPRNRIVVDGQPVDERYLYFDPAAGEAKQKPFAKVTVPRGELFVMGDNRNASIDSRAPGNGPVPVSALAGKVRLIVTPFDRFGTLDHTDPRTLRR